MIVGDRLKAIRESKSMSQGDIEQRTGLLRCYTSRVENGHTVPSVETLEKYARAMEVPLYQIFFDSQDGSPEELKLPKRAAMKLSGKDASVVSRLSKLVSRMDDRNKKLLISMAQKLAARDA
jgi:transcriptional regulator with XRE-family HTH domain